MEESSSTPEATAAPSPSDVARFDSLQRRLSAPIPAVVRGFAATAPFWWGLILAVLAGAGVFALVVVAASSLSSNAQQGPATIAIAVLCIPMAWEWLWHALAPHLGVDMIDVLHGYWAHVLLAALAVLLLLGPWFLATAAEQLQKTREKIREQIAAAGTHLHRVLSSAEEEERKARQDAWSTFWAAIVLATVVLTPLLGGLGVVAEWLADNPGPPHAFPLNTPRAWWPRSSDNKPLPGGEGGEVTAFSRQNGHDRAWYFVPLRRGERLRLGHVDPNLRVTLQAREPSPFYRIEWSWEDAEDPLVAAYTGWYRIKVDSANGKAGRVQWFIE